MTDDPWTLAVLIVGGMFGLLPAFILFVIIALTIIDGVLDVLTSLAHAIFGDKNGA